MKLHCCLFLFLFPALPVQPPVEIQNNEEAIFYNTYGYVEGDEWVIPIRVYVMESRSYFERAVTGIFRRTRNLTSEEREVFRTRIAHFLVDSESRENLIFQFENDPKEADYQLYDEAGNVLQTDLNGIVAGEIRLSLERADELIDAQNASGGWLTVIVRSDEHTGTGKVRLIGQHGLSVISDIDDTVKISGLPAGRNYIIRNTFFEEFKAAPGMANRYQMWDEAAFHYVSGAPWQLYRPFSEFLFSEKTGFPEGSFHMKFVPKNLISISTWRSLTGLISNENMTYDQKIGQISGILDHFPYREFILVGDSGEMDPEVYRELSERYPDQIKDIIIRDVVNDRNVNPERLQGMTNIPAPTFIRALND